MNTTEEYTEQKRFTVSGEQIPFLKNFSIYRDSVRKDDGVTFMIALRGTEKSLLLIYKHDGVMTAAKFDGEVFAGDESGDYTVKNCGLTTANRKALQEIFEFTRPVVAGLSNSFGFGDRIGLANAGHIRSLKGSAFKPILAQQSIRELGRTNRKPEDVMDAAVWAVFQEGYTAGFGADADHLKTFNDIDLMVNAGFRFFTFDPSEHVQNEADTLDEAGLDEYISKIDWTTLNSGFEEQIALYTSKPFVLPDSLILAPHHSDLKRAVVKYGNALAHIKRLSDHLHTAYPEYESETEVSVDETDSVTSPFEHFYIAAELKRMGIPFVSLAPRFIGAFEKGIDYRGDLELFRQEYLKHLAIVRYHGSYKISLHSGSDKFSVYKVIGSLSNAFTHVKTAGTSYLEALKVAAIKQPSLFREILDFSRSIYEGEKKTYHVSADLNTVKSGSELGDAELVSLFSHDDSRQVLHVCFGRVLTEKDQSGNYRFKQKLIDCLNENENTHYEILIQHFKKHLEPFGIA
ncbi:MAG: tagaturonate epimerase family protein [Ignavibacteriaceae bacterium]|nr:tagaturonate epimerase family protein [Ignavibacteriaceae bacterium]